MADQETRRCIGSKRFGVEPHDTPINEFPAQPSQKDGLGRMCATHWRAYTAGLARDAKARKAAADASPEATEEGGAAPKAESTAAAPRKGRRAKAATEEVPTS